jgi:hypothetical protein
MTYADPQRPFFWRPFPPRRESWQLLACHSRGPQNGRSGIHKPQPLDLERLWIPGQTCGLPGMTVWWRKPDFLSFLLSSFRGPPVTCIEGLAPFPYRGRSGAVLSPTLAAAEPHREQGNLGTLAPRRPAATTGPRLSFLRKFFCSHSIASSDSTPPIRDRGMKCSDNRRNVKNKQRTNEE